MQRVDAEARAEPPGERMSAECMKFEEDPSYGKLGDSGDSGESGVMMLHEECEDPEDMPSKKVVNNPALDDQQNASSLLKLTNPDPNFDQFNLFDDKLKQLETLLATALPLKSPLCSPSAILDFGYRTDTNGSTVAKSSNINPHPVHYDVPKSTKLTSSIFDRPSLVDKLIACISIWFIPDISRESVQYLLSINFPGNFIIRRCSKKDCLALSIKQDPGLEPKIEHYLIEVAEGCVKLEESKYTFPDLPFLLAFYIENLEELPCKLSLPQIIERSNEHGNLEFLNSLGKDFWVIHESMISSMEKVKPKNSTPIFNRNTDDSGHGNRCTKSYSINKKFNYHPMHMSSSVSTKVNYDKGYVLTTLENKLGIVIDNNPWQPTPANKCNVVNNEREKRNNPYREVNLPQHFKDDRHPNGMEFKMRLNYEKKKQEYPLMLHEQKTNTPKAPDSNIRKDRVCKNHSVGPKISEVLASQDVKKSNLYESLANREEEPTVIKCHFKPNGIPKVANENDKQSINSNDSIKQKRVRRKRVRKRPTQISPIKNGDGTSSLSDDSRRVSSKSPNVSTSTPNKSFKNSKSKNRCKSVRNQCKIITDTKQQVTSSPIIDNDFVKIPENTTKEEMCKKGEAACPTSNGDTIGIYKDLATLTIQGKKVTKDSTAMAKSLCVEGEKIEKSYINDSTFDIFDKLLQVELDKLEEMGRSCDAAAIIKINEIKNISQSNEINEDTPVVLDTKEDTLSNDIKKCVQNDKILNVCADDAVKVRCQVPEKLDYRKSFSIRCKKDTPRTNAKNNVLLNKFYRVFNGGKNTLTSSWEWIPPYINSKPGHAKIIKNSHLQGSSEMKNTPPKPTDASLEIINNQEIMSNACKTDVPLEKILTNPPDTKIARPTSSDTVFSHPWDMSKNPFRLSSYLTYPKTKATNPINSSGPLNKSLLNSSQCNISAKFDSPVTDLIDKLDAPNISEPDKLEDQTPPNDEKVFENENNTRMTAGHSEEIWKLNKTGQASLSSSQNSIDIASQMSVDRQSLSQRFKETKEFWTLRSTKKNQQFTNVIANGYLCPTIASGTSSIIFGKQQMSPRIGHPIWSTLRMKSQSQTITGYVMGLAADKNTFIGSTIENFVECIKNRKADTNGGNPYEMIKNIRQLMDGLKNYLSNMTNFTGPQCVSTSLNVSSQFWYKNRQDINFDTIVKRECEKLGPNKFLNLDTLLEAIMQSLVIKPLNGTILKHVANFHNLNGNRGKVRSCLNLMKLNLTENSTDNAKIPKFGCERMCRENTVALFEALDIYFQKLKETYSPVKKLKNLLKIFNTIKEFLVLNDPKMKQGASGAENIINPNHLPTIANLNTIVPIFIYGLANSTIDDIEIEAEYMWFLLHPHFKDGIEGYHLITLLSAIEMMKNIEDIKNNLGPHKDFPRNDIHFEKLLKSDNNLTKPTVKYNRSFFFKKTAPRNKSFTLLKTLDEKNLSLKMINNSHPTSSTLQEIKSCQRKYNSVNTKSVLKDTNYRRFTNEMLTHNDFINQNRACIWDYDGFLPIFITHERDNLIKSYILPVRSQMKTEEVCKMIAFCFNIVNSSEYGLFYVTNERETFLNAASTPCQNICRNDLKSSRCHLIYKRKDARIAWNAMQPSLENHSYPIL